MVDDWQPPFPSTATPRVSAPGTPLSMACQHATAVRDADDLYIEDEKVATGPPLASGPEPAAAPPLPDSGGLPLQPTVEPGNEPPLGVPQNPLICRIGQPPDRPHPLPRVDSQSLPGQSLVRPRRIHLAKRPVKFLPYWQYPRIQESPSRIPGRRSIARRSTGRRCCRSDDPGTCRDRSRSSHRRDVAALPVHDAAGHPRHGVAADAEDPVSPSVALAGVRATRAQRQPIAGSGP